MIDHDSVLNQGFLLNCTPRKTTRRHILEIKSLVQVICGGHSEGAAQTQKDFLHQCPGVSQVTSLVQLVAGDKDGALETQKQCLENVARVADGILIIGHFKGFVHYAFDDDEAGARSMLSASRTTGAMAAGALGFAVAGPVGAVVDGITGAGAFDSTVTAGDSAVHGEYRPSGYYAAINHVMHNPSPGYIFNACLMPVGDGLAGYAAGRLSIAKQIHHATAGGHTSGATARNISAAAAAAAVESQAQAMLDAAEEGKLDMPSGEYLRMVNPARDLWEKAQRIKGGEAFVHARNSPSLTSEVAAVQAAASTTLVQHQQDDEFMPSEFTELWAIWLDDTTPIIGAERLHVEMVAAFIGKDRAKLEEGCQQLGWKYDFLFAEWSRWTIEKIMCTLEKMGALKGQRKQDLVTMYNTESPRTKKAVKIFLSNSTAAIENELGKEEVERRNHVIRKNVLFLSRDIMNTFLVREKLPTQADLQCPFSEVDEQITQDILSTTTVPCNENYIDASGMIFGSVVFMLQELCLQHMQELYHNDSSQCIDTQWTVPLRTMTDAMISQLMFVDNYALAVWSQRGPSEMEMSEKAKKTAEVFLTELPDRAQRWVIAMKCPEPRV